MQLAFLLNLAAAGICQGFKGDTLTLFTAIPFTGLEPRDGKSCQAAAEIVVREVNRRTDILPTYHLEVDYQDEGPNSFQMVKTVVQFVRQYPNKVSLQAPVTVGPYFTCGCQRYGSLVHHLNMVTIGTGCQSPFFTANRRSYPNLYRMRVTGELVVHPWLKFIQEVGNWRTIAILTWAGNAFDYSIAGTFYSASLAAGLNVVWYNSPADMDDVTIESLRLSEARIIAIPIGEVNVVVKFFCQAYKFDIKGSKFVFLGLTKAYTNPTAVEANGIPAGCSMDILIEQMKITFWGGDMYSAAFNYGKTSLGYDLTEFEEIFDRMTNKSRTPDYDRRHQCHDAMLQAVLTLDQSEKVLKSKWNLTLEDYPRQPKLVMKVVNETAPLVEYDGLRTGHVHYSQRAELDDEPQCIAQWINGSLQVLFLIVGNQSRNAASVTQYGMKAVLSPVWTSLHGRPPKDAIELIVTKREMSIAEIILVCFFCCGSVGLDLTLMFRQFRHSQLWRSKCFLLSGCVLLNLTALTFALPMDLLPPLTTSKCLLRPIFGALGLSLINSYLFSSLLFSTIRIHKVLLKMSNKVRPSQEERRGQSAHHPRVSAQASRRPTRHSSLPKPVIHLAKVHDVFVIGCISLFALANGVILLVWGTVNPPEGRLVELDPQPRYDSDTDTYETVVMYLCRKDAIWQLSLAAIDFAALFTGCFLSWRLATRVVMPEQKQTRYDLISSASMSVALVLILYIIQPSPYLQHIIAAWVFMLMSFCTAATVCYPALKELFVRRG